MPAAATTRHILFVSSLSQKIMFDEFFRSEIVEGIWAEWGSSSSYLREHTRHWKDIKVEVVSRELIPGRSFYACKSDYQLARNDLLTCLASKILAKVNIILNFGIEEDYWPQIPNDYDAFAFWLYDSTTKSFMTSHGITEEAINNLKFEPIYLYIHMRRDITKLKKAMTNLIKAKDFPKYPNLMISLEDQTRTLNEYRESIGRDSYSSIAYLVIETS